MYQDITSYEQVGNTTLWNAIKDSNELGLATIDFHDIIWEKDVEPIVVGLRSVGVTELTISSSQTRMAEILELFINQGCKIVTVVRVKQRFDRDDPAFMLAL